jgi:hypothetical protein
MNILDEKDIEIEKLRMSLIMSSLEFMNTIADNSYLSFAEVERNTIRMILGCSDEEIRNLIQIRSSAFYK